MKNREADILILPGIGGGIGDASDPEIWYRRWAKSLSTASIVHQTDWHNPALTDWTATLTATVKDITRPVILVGHSAGALTIAHAYADSKDPGAIRGAFLVAPPDPKEAVDAVPALRAFDPVPSAPLPFPSMLIAGKTDPYCAFSTATDMGLDWGSIVINAGDAGHVNIASGHGPWPEGLMMFTRFLNQL